MYRTAMGNGPEPSGCVTNVVISPSAVRMRVSRSCISPPRFQPRRRRRRTVKPLRVQRLRRPAELRLRECRLGLRSRCFGAKAVEREQLADPLFQDRLDERLTGREMAVQRADPDPGAARDLLERRLDSLLGEDLPRGGD